MNKIRVLDEKVANKIAAGEVVERPASVIKELVENSIDAGATFISIEIENGGLSYIRVSDNGCGIEKNDVKTCFLRHATSKIHDAEDLFAIKTLGFRGEAMASIAAVSHVMLKTHRKCDDFGTQIYVSGGDVRSIEPCGCPDGTIVEVSDLFFNVPARLKFMKAARTEAGYISDYILRMVLARPDISIRFINNGNIIYHSSGNGDLRNAVYSVYGAEALPHMKPLFYSDEYIKISGFIGSEQITKPNRSYQSMFVNGRYIRSQKLSAALLAAYDTRIMSGRFPLAVLNFQIGYGEVDVNVHPNKLEIKFSDELRVSDTLYKAAKQALGRTSVPTTALPGDEQAKPVEELKDEPTAEEKEKLFSILMSQINITESDVKVQENIKTETEPRVETEPTQQKILPQEQEKREIPFFEEPKKLTETVKTKNDETMLTQVKFEVMPYEILGSVYDSFWIICQNDNLFILDQHAAHERMIYEQLMKGELKANSQMLLIPFVVKLTGDEYRVYTENEELFREFGFIIEPFGTLTLRISATPHILKKAEDDRFFRDAIAQLAKQKGATLTELKREALIQASCKAAIKLGNAVPKEMIKAMLDEYNESGIPLTCPHGRPVMIAITKKDMFKRFKRIL